MQSGELLVSIEIPDPDPGVLNKSTFEMDLKCKVTSFVEVKGNPNTWDSDLDYHGYVEVEYELYSPAGDRLYKVEELIDGELDQQIVQQIMNYRASMEE